MPLLKTDIDRINPLNLIGEPFTIEKDGWLQLKNVNGQCIFHDGTQCTVYEKRPEGCTLYPLIYEEETECGILDEECPYASEFPLSKRKQVQLRSLITKLKNERKQRQS
jgi:Fe-S-cluster containining protein